MIESKDCCVYLPSRDQFSTNEQYTFLFWTWSNVKARINSEGYMPYWRRVFKIIKSKLLFVGMLTA